MSISTLSHNPSKMAPAITTAVSAGPSTMPSPLIDVLPGEIRNQIIELCIKGALSNRTLPSLSSGSSGITISVLPKWSGPCCLKMNGIGALPLLFVNKQLYKEVQSFVDSMVDEVSIGGYILQYPNEDPNLRWALAYSLLDKRPNILSFVKNIKINLPRGIDERCQHNWALMGLSTRKNSGECKSWLVLPDLERYLQKFSACEKPVIVVAVEEKAPPDFNKLLSLYIARQGRLTIEFVTPRSPNTAWVRNTPRGLPWYFKWEVAWIECLSRKATSAMNGGDINLVEAS
ncbi:uncharacterized protein PAC_13223 [Phialocephala subalpina]|uniref:Uncharacterized protein n=1 Tax=Phialocephala subalpina TaxID=576137 RepID=A0A1L7XEC7_9HELO|nr:uncharacterized protein PAC_13223 [Phialocephala subalpina]